MKKLLLFVAVVLSITATKAQSAVRMAIIAGDTVITSSSLDTVTKVLPVTAGYSAMGIQVIGTKVGGTITSKAYLAGSLDGVTYTVTDSSSAFANAAGDQSVFFTKTGGLPYTYYRIQVKPPTSAASTESLAVRVYYSLKRFDATKP